MSFRRIWLPGLALLVASCGGGGGSSTITPATQFRANAPGDSWTYTVQIDFGVFGTFPGSLSQSIATDTFNGSPSIRTTQVFTVDMKTGPSALTSYAEYSVGGQLLAETVNGTLLEVTADSFNVPNTLGAGTTASGTVTFSDGSFTQYTYDVLGAEAVSTPFGPFSCWRVSESDTQSDGTTDAFQQWVAPETGNYVLLKDKTANPNGTGYTYTAALTGMTTVGATNISLRKPMSHLIGIAASALTALRTPR